MGRTLDHIRRLREIAREEGVGSAIKCDWKETWYDFGEVASEIFLGGPVRVLMTIGAVLIVPAYLLGTTNC